MNTLLRTVRALTLCLGGLSGTVAAEGDAGTSVQRIGETIEYRGPLSEEANQLAFYLYEHSELKPTELLIDSNGGSADAGMQLGRWIVAHSLDIRVMYECLSSCANYVLPAGRIKRLSPRAVLMWHGGATQPLSDAALERILDTTLTAMTERDRGELLRHTSRARLLADLRESQTALIQREAQYFDMIGVDPRLATLGHLYEHDVLSAGEYFIGWDYSIEDLVTLGVHDVIVIGDGAWVPEPSSRGAIYRLRLRDLPGFEPRLPARD